MAIVASEIDYEDAQVDGRIYVRERHTDHVGVVHYRVFLAPNGYDAQGGLAGNAAILADWLAAQELAENVEEFDNAEL